MTKQYDSSDFGRGAVQAAPNPSDNARLARARRKILALAAGHYPISNTQVARSVAYSAAEAVWQTLANLSSSNADIRPLFNELEVTPLPRIFSSVVADFAEKASILPPLWVAYEIGQIYSSLLPQKDRKLAGLHFTPPQVAQEIVRCATEVKPIHESARILEPSAGGGVLLIAALNRLLATGIECDKALLTNLPSHVVALERDPFAAWLAQIAVDIRLLALATHHDLELPRIVQVVDTLQQTFEGDFDFVIMNPPYGRTKLNSDQRQKFKRSLFGHANAYTLFFDQALQSAKPDGVIASLTPTSFLSSQYFQCLRGTLRSEASLKKLGVFDTRSGIFEGIQQELALSIFQKSASPRSTTVNHLGLDFDTSVKTKLLGEYNLPEDLAVPWVIPRTEAQVSIARSASHATNRLKDWGYAIKTGPVVWNRFKPQISHAQGPDAVPLIWSACIQNGGGFSWPPDARKDKAWIKLLPDQRHCLQSKPCVLLQRTTSREQSRRLVATPLPSYLIDKFGAVAVENHVQILEPTAERPEVTLEALVEFLNSSTADTLFRCISGSVSVSAFELNSLPLPTPESLADLNALVERAASSEELDHEIQRLYHAAAKAAKTLPVSKPSNL
ncbi:HsdM family class I SAM-dependent methyltransferase (plasmid) [Shimia sp. W99]